MSVGGLIGKPHLENKCIPSLYRHVRGRALLRAINHCEIVCGMCVCICVSSCAMTPEGSFAFILDVSHTALPFIIGYSDTFLTVDLGVMFNASRL